jgi:diguanylate cyclase
MSAAATLLQPIAWPLLAAAVGGLGVLVTLMLLHQAYTAPKSQALAWRATAAAVLGGVFWSTQALLLSSVAWPPGVRVDFLGQAVAALAAVALAVPACELLVRHWMQRWAFVAAGLVCGVATLVVHQIGIGAVNLLPAAQTPWMALVAPALVGLSTAVIGFLLVAAAAQMGGRRSNATALAAVGLLGVGGSVAVYAAGLAVQVDPAATLVPAGIPIDTINLLALIGAPMLFASAWTVIHVLRKARMSVDLARQNMEQASRRDALTGLLNRPALDEQLAQLCRAAESRGSRVALVFIDLDGFKAINEACGHELGDEVLKAIAARLRVFLADDLALGRLNGDKFLLLLPDASADADLSRLASRIIETIQRPLMIGGRELLISGSIGVSVYPDHGALPVLTARAERAATAAKRSGGGTHCFFEASMAAPARDQMDLVRDLRQAIEQRQLELFYQPKVHAPSGEITGAEALLRWRHPSRGMVSPGVFIPVAEKFGLIGALGNWVIDESCRQARAWRDQGLRMRVSINLSMQQLRQEDLVARIAAAIKRYRVDPSHITCEITETAAMDDAAGTRVVLEALAKVGVHISIDDFGAGYSSLAYLRQLPAKELKIDQSFVADLETSADARAIVDAVVKLGKTLRLKVVAEGVETEAQQKILASLGCDELQGYLFAKPMSATALGLWAMDDVGPRQIAFRDSLFGLSTQQLPMSAPQAAAVNKAQQAFRSPRPTPAAAPAAGAPATSAPTAGRRNAIH